MRMSIWDPFTSRSMQNFWDDNFPSNYWEETELDMYEEDDSFVVNIKAPGFDEKNVKLTMDGNSLTVTGNMESKEEESDKKKKYYKKEIRQSSFTRTISFPKRVVTDQISAKFKNGILTVTLPKAEEDKPKEIEIKPE